MRIGGKMYLAQQSRQSSFGYAKQLNRRALEQSMSSALQYGQSVFTAQSTFLEENAKLTLQSVVDRLQSATKTKVSNALTVDTSDYTSNSASVDLLT